MSILDGMWQKFWSVRPPQFEKLSENEHRLMGLCFKVGAAAMYRAVYRLEETATTELERNHFFDSVEAELDMIMPGWRNPDLSEVETPGTRAN